MAEPGTGAAPRTTTIAELSGRGVLSYGDGYRTKRAEHGTPGYRILRVADVGDDRVVPDGDDHVRLDFTRAIGPKASRAGDVLLTTKGTVGRVAVYPDGAEQVVYSPQLCWFRVADRDVLDPRFLAYWFRSEDFRRQAAYRANNTDMAAYINLRDIASLSLRLPPIGDQRAVVDVLGALDDAIVANDHRLGLVDRLADALFARAVGATRPGDLTFADVADVGGGGTPRTAVDAYWGGTVPWATPTDVTALRAPYLDATHRTITDEGLASCASPLYPAGSVLMTSRATIGAFAVAQVPTAVNQGFVVVNAKDPELQWWLFHEMRSRTAEFLSFANGATFLELPRSRFRSLPVRLPDVDAARAFGDAVRPLHALAAGLVRQNDRLRATRDDLLPLLLSDRVTVSGAAPDVTRQES